MAMHLSLLHHHHHHHRRSAISVQDLLCQNSSETSSCHSPTTNNTPFSSPPHPLPLPPSSSHSLPLSEIDPASVSDQEQTSPSHHHHHHHHHLTHTETSIQLDISSPSAPSSSLPSNLLDTRHKSVRGPWRIEEDRLLIDLVNRYGPKHWSSIATHFPRRSGKQARERWMNQLNPNLKKKNWTPHEDRTILKAHASLGNKWSAIAQMLPGRTDNSVKNRYNSTLKRAMKERGITAPNFDIDHFVDNLHARHYLVTHSFHDSPLDHVLPTKVSAATFSSDSADVHRQCSPDCLNTFRMQLSPQKQQQQQPLFSANVMEYKNTAWDGGERDYRSGSKTPHPTGELTSAMRSEPVPTGMASSGHAPKLPAFHQVLGNSTSLPSRKADMPAPDYRETSLCTVTNTIIPRHRLLDQKPAGDEDSLVTWGHHNNELCSDVNSGSRRTDVLSPSKIIAKKQHLRA